MLRVCGVRTECLLLSFVFFLIVSFITECDDRKQRQKTYPMIEIWPLTKRLNMRKRLLDKTLSFLVRKKRVMMKLCSSSLYPVTDLPRARWETSETQTGDYINICAAQGSSPRPSCILQIMLLCPVH